MKQLIFILSFLLINVSISAQVIKRDEQLKSLEEKLKQLSETMPGLKEEIDLSVSDVNIQDFIHAIAQSNKINIHINPDLDMRVNNNFSDVSVSSILIFLCKQYNLDIEIYNNILSISKWIQNETQSEIKLPKELDIRYNANKRLISMDLNSDTLSRIVKEVTKLTGRNVLYGPEVGNNIITFFIENLSVENAINKLALTNGLQTSITEDSCILIDKQGSSIIGEVDNINQSSNKKELKRKKSRKNDFDYLSFHADFRDDPMIFYRLG